MPISMRLSWMMFPTTPQQSRAVLRGAHRGTTRKTGSHAAGGLRSHTRRRGYGASMMFSGVTRLSPSCFGSGVDGPHMLPASRRIGVQADTEGWRGAVARRTRAGVDQAAHKPGFPALGRAVFHPPEEAVGCEVAIEAAAHFGGIAAETGEEIEAFSAARRRHRPSGQTRALCQSAPGSR